MSTMAFDHVGPWTEDDYFALGETSDRIELFDGSLVVSPGPALRHQDVSRRLANALEAAAEADGLLVFEAINVRLRPGRVPIPDLVITRDVDLGSLAVDAAATELVCEITSPGNAGNDRVLKMHLYAEAGIGWYLLVDPEPLMLRLFRLDGDKYVQHTIAGVGEILRLTEPIRVDIDTSVLVRHRPASGPTG
jgi:Uma2 family endonuclease